MANNQNPFGFGPGEFDEFAREARDAIGRVVGGAGARGLFSNLFEAPAPRPRPQPETAGEKGDGVWAVIAKDDEGTARVEQVYASELDALRAQQHNTDSTRRVRFLPYGIAVTALDD